jgi:hypothetical protein
MKCCEYGSRSLRKSDKYLTIFILFNRYEVQSNKQFYTRHYKSVDE